MTALFRRLFLRREIGEDLSAEMRTHLDERIAALIAGGMNAREAEHMAQLEFGNLTRVEETSRDVWRWAKLENFAGDVRFALRMLRKSPGFTAVAILTLALGIGANTAMYTIVSSALTWDMGLKNRDQFVSVASTDVKRGRDLAVSYPDFRDLRARTKSLAGLAAYELMAVNLSDASALPDRYYDAVISANGPSVAEEAPMLGRDFVAADERPGAPAVVILGYHVWRDRYASNPAIIGNTVRIDEVPHVIIGVMPPLRRFPEDTDLWTPLIADSTREKRDARNLMLFGRMAEGASVPKVRAELTSISQNLADEYPATNAGVAADVKPILYISGLYQMRPILLVLFGAVEFVLLIACADLTNILLVRAADRSREISIRIAIGAGKAAILRQLLVESTLLSIAGGAAGCIVALGGLRLFDSGIGNFDRPLWLHPALDRNALLYLTMVSVLTGIIFGLAPALQLARTDLSKAMKEGGTQGAAGSKFGSRLSNALVALQVALCAVLLVGAGLLIRSAVNLYSAPVGVKSENVLTMRISLPETKYPTEQSWISFHENLQRSLASVPGVRLAGIASNLPLGGWIPARFEIEGAKADPSHLPSAGTVIVSNDYFQLMGVTARRGRTFSKIDGKSDVPVAVVNDTFAAKFLSGRDAIGTQLRTVDSKGSPGSWLTVIGVIPDVLQNNRNYLQRDPIMYLPFAERPVSQAFLIARTLVPPTNVADEFRRSVQSLDSNLPVFNVMTLDSRIAESRLGPKLFGGICSVFAVIALILATVGLYAVIAHVVSKRTAEIGVRMALGASRKDIARAIVLQSARPVAIGLAVGLVLALGASRLLSSILLGVSPNDPITFLVTLLALLAAAILGCAVPTRRAISVDPVIALRAE